MPDGIAGDHITWLFKQPGEQEVHDFWTRVEEIMAFPDEHTQQLLIGHAPVRKCVCGVPCSIVVCKITGDIFWTCAPKKCFYLLFSQRRQKIGDMDVGQLVGFGDSRIDRYTTHQHIMKWFGYSFSKKFFLWLLGRPADADFPPGSYQVERRQEYDGFISYRGGTGRFEKI